MKGRPKLSMLASLAAAITAAIKGDHPNVGRAKAQLENLHRQRLFGVSRPRRPRAVSSMFRGADLYGHWAPDRDAKAKPLARFAENLHTLRTSQGSQAVHRARREAPPPDYGPDEAEGA